MMNRAYSLLTVKSVDDDKRIIEGIATTPEPDRMGDIVETEGIEFKLPLPLLYQHNSRQPIGSVVSAKVSKDGITIKAQIAGTGVAMFIDEAWALIKAGLVRGLSIGFNSLEHAWMDDSNGIRFIRSEWLELSCVTIAANSSATITSVKSADALLLAATGITHPRPVRLDKRQTLPGVSGSPGRKDMTIKEQIEQFQNKRATNVARMKAIMDKAGETGSTLDAAEAEEHDTLETEVAEIDKHLVRLAKHEKTLAATATAVTKDNTADAAKASETRGGVITVVSNLPKGIGFARAAIALMACKGNRSEAAEQAKKHWPDMGTELEMVIKAEQLPGTTTGTTWAAPLIQSSGRLVGEFIEMLRPATIIGRIPNLRRVPFNVTVPLQTGGGTYQWVGENIAKPVSGLALGTAVLRWAKVAGIIPFTKEAMKFSDPSIETIVRNDMIAGTARYLDQQFIDPAVHESVNVSPASITDQIVNTAASGTTATALRADLRNIVGKFITNNEDPSTAVILMSATLAMNISSLMNSLSQPEFPTLNMQGGTLWGIPVIVSQNVGARIILLNPSEILIAMEDGVTIDVSEEASLIMTTTPASSPAASQMVSMFQTNNIAVRVEQFITWKRAVTTAVEYLSSAVYSG